MGFGLGEPATCDESDWSCHVVLGGPSRQPRPCGTSHCSYTGRWLVTRACKTGHLEWPGGQWGQLGHDSGPGRAVHASREPYTSRDRAQTWRTTGQQARMEGCHKRGWWLRATSKSRRQLAASCSSQPQCNATDALLRPFASALASRFREHPAAILQLATQQAYVGQHVLSAGGRSLCNRPEAPMCANVSSEHDSCQVVARDKPSCG